MMWIYPWDDKKFAGTRQQKLYIYQKLDSLGYQLERYRMPPAKDILTVLLKRLLDLEKALASPGERPWMLLVCNSPVVLEAVAEALPMIWALSTQNAVYNTNTAELVRLFSQPRPLDDWSDDPTGEVLHAIEMAGMVVWERVDAKMRGSITYEAEYLQLFRRNFSTRKDCLLLTFYHESVDPFRPEDVAEVENQIRVTLGASFASLFNSYGIKRLLYLPTTVPDWHSETIQ